MAEAGFPIFPVQNQYVKFNLNWVFVDRFSNEVPSGTIGYILKTDIINGSAFDEAQAYILYIGVKLKEDYVVVKINYLDRPDIITIIPDSPAAKVLYGK